MIAASEKQRVKSRLIRQRNELTRRLERIRENLTRPLDSDSKERALQLENHDVVDALGNETREELEQIAVALARLEEGSYGICDACGAAIPVARLDAWPYALHCIDCADRQEQVRSQH